MVVSHVVLPSLRQEVTELQKSLVSEAKAADASSDKIASTGTCCCTCRRAGIAACASLFLCHRRRSRRRQRPQAVHRDCSVLHLTRLC